MKEVLEKLWSPEDRASPLPLRIIASLLAVAWGVLIRCRNYLYNRGFFTVTSLPVPVISVGNLTSGGTGKTSLVIELARYFVQNGFTPAVLSRGYGGSNRAPVTLVSDGKAVLADPEAVGEEPVMMARLLPGVPVLVGPKRVLTGKVACEVYQADLLILDDAFQHRSLARNLDMVLLDSRHPYGNGHLLPRGLLREPPSCLSRADVIVFTGSLRLEMSDRAKLPAVGEKPVFHAWQRPTGLRHPASGATYPTAFLKGKKVYFFCGLGAPERFAETLLSLGAVLAGRTLFPDHHRYKREDLADTIRLADLSGADLIVTTAKDEVKLTSWAEYHARIHILTIELAIDPAENQRWRELLEKVTNSGKLTKNSGSDGK